jgi:UDP-N-acetyl-D-mannosaminuronic acid dehydrogenase
MSFRTISVIGLGYIGLPTAAILADHGSSVVGVDTNPHVVETINRGKIHIVEPALDVMVQRAVAKGALRAVTRPEPSDAFLIAVPTPITEDKKADLSYVLAAAEAITAVLKVGDLIILESTSPVGTTEAMIARLARLRPDLRFPSRESDVTDVNVAYCPERVLPGKVVQELVSNDRAIGGVTAGCAERARELYRLFVKGELVSTDVRSAELCKLAENAFRDVNIAYANELANVCQSLGINVWEVIRLANRHPRVDILRPGPGVGGHCIAVDPWFIAESAPDDTPLIQAARRVNDGRPRRVMAQVREAVSRLQAGGDWIPTIACLGLAFKPDIDDLRESPAVEVVQLLLQADLGDILVAEPNIRGLPKDLSDRNLKLVDTDVAMAAADIVLLLVDHSAFRSVDKDLAKKVVIDTRGLWDRQAEGLTSPPVSADPARLIARG